MQRGNSQGVTGELPYGIELSQFRFRVSKFHKKTGREQLVAFRTRKERVQLAVTSDLLSYLHNHFTVMHQTCRMVCSRSQNIME